MMDSLLKDARDVEPLAVLSRFRRDFHACLTARADELFELADAVLCADGPVRDLAGLSLAAEHRRGHGALYDAVNCGRMDIGRLRRSPGGGAHDSGSQYSCGASAGSSSSWHSRSSHASRSAAVIGSRSSQARSSSHPGSAGTGSGGMYHHPFGRLIHVEHNSGIRIDFSTRNAQ
jgi:hypothetical protein